jgi:hypothetical protein
VKPTSRGILAESKPESRICCVDNGSIPAAAKAAGIMSQRTHLRQPGQ